MIFSQERVTSTLSMYGATHAVGTIACEEPRKDMMEDIMKRQQRVPRPSSHTSQRDSSGNFALKQGRCKVGRNGSCRKPVEKTWNVWVQPPLLQRFRLLASMPRRALTIRSRLLYLMEDESEEIERESPHASAKN